MSGIHLFPVGGNWLGIFVLQPEDVVGVLARRAALLFCARHCDFVFLAGSSFGHATIYALSGLCDGDSVTAAARRQAPLLVGN